MVGVTVGRDQTGFPIGFICRVNLFCCRMKLAEVIHAKCRDTIRSHSIRRKRKSGQLYTKFLLRHRLTVFDYGVKIEHSKLGM